MLSWIAVVHSGGIYLFDSTPAVSEQDCALHEAPQLPQKPSSQRSSHQPNSKMQRFLWCYHATNSARIIRIHRPFTSPTLEVAVQLLDARLALHLAEFNVYCAHSRPIYRISSHESDFMDF